jgi:hypothetical protein
MILRTPRAMSSAFNGMYACDVPTILAVAAALA